ncbi:MAG TPA: BamA/TamA family outer membrane protein, partial [Candidatus Binataceae bacterium]|nr:BamA/TamA family outer membrane protein [Candidatus Binataceae bacterium]
MLISIASFFVVGIPICRAAWASSDAPYPITESDAEGDGPIAENPVEPPAFPPGGVSAPMSSSHGGEVPKSEATPAAGTSSPSAASSPVAASSPAAASSPSVTDETNSSHTGVAEVFHPEEWQWPHKFSLTDPDTWPFIPVPEVATDPNGGTTVGILAAVLFTDSKNQITDILAPDAEVNTVQGTGGTFRYLSYPSEDTNWYVTVGAQVKIARHLDLDYQTGRTHKNWWSFEGRFFFEKDPTERFFGVGNESLLGNQTNYTTNQAYGLAVLGLNFTENLQLALSVRPRRVRIQRGAFNNIPQIFRLFPHQKGIDGGSEVPVQLSLTYDTRDSLEVPRSGGLATIYFGIADRAFLSSVSYTRFGGELRRYYAINDKVTLAGHVFVEYNPSGNETPFWSMARLGGQESLLVDQETLRGFGTGRFIDNNLAVANGEVRTRVWDRDIFGTHG